GAVEKGDTPGPLRLPSPPVIPGDVITLLLLKMLGGLLLTMPALEAGALPRLLVPGIVTTGPKPGVITLPEPVMGGAPCGAAPVAATATKSIVSRAIAVFFIRM